MPRFTLDHLDETTFEEFCYDLLQELGFANVKWRKGTGKPVSSADQGRDIECERTIIDPIDGHVHMEKWFIECKHYLQGVPPERLQGALAWATAEKADCLVIIVSNFLSNPAKDFLRDYRINFNPHLKVRVWERPALEKMASVRVKLLRKYNIPSDFSFIAVMHPAHLMFVRSAPINSLDYFFDVLDGIAPETRDGILSWVYDLIIQPRMREPIHENESLKDLYLDEVSYDAFKRRCYELSEVIYESFLVHGIVSWCVDKAFSIADKTSVEDKIDEFQRSIEHWRELMAKSDEELAEYEKIFEGTLVSSTRILTDRGKMARHIEFMENDLKEYPDRVLRNYALYEEFCVVVIEKLLQEKPFFGTVEE